MNMNARPGGPSAGAIALDKAQPRRRPDVEAHEVMEEAVLYDPEREMAFSLNLSARAVWELCTGQHTVAAINERLSQVLGCPSEALAEDVEGAVRRLYELNLITLERAS